MACAPREMYVKGCQAVYAVAVQEVNRITVETLDTAAESAAAPFEVHSCRVEWFRQRPGQCIAAVGIQTLVIGFKHTGEGQADPDITAGVGCNPTLKLRFTPLA